MKTSFYRYYLNVFVFVLNRTEMFSESVLLNNNLFKT